MIKIKGISTKLNLSLILAYSASSFALEPPTGPYGGIVLGGSYAFPISLTSTSGYLNDAYNKYPDFANLVGNLQKNASAKVTYSFMGMLGAQLGYRYENFRAEAQFMYNSNNFDTLNVNNIKIRSNKNKSVYVSGQSNIYGGLANFYYDLLPPANVEAQLAPFVGFGVGYVQIQNNFHLNIGTTQIPNPNPITNVTFLPSTSAAAGQLIGGLLYFLDDFSFFGLDCRLFSTANINNYATGTNNKAYRYQLISVNLSFNGSFDLG